MNSANICLITRQGDYYSPERLLCQTYTASDISDRYTEIHLQIRGVGAGVGKVVCKSFYSFGLFRIVLDWLTDWLIFGV